MTHQRPNGVAAFVLVLGSSAVCAATAMGRDAPGQVMKMTPRLVRAGQQPRVAVIAARSLEDRSKEAIEAIRGQLTGVPAQMFVEWVDTLEVTLPAQVRVAREVAKRTGATMVLWADLSLPDQIFVYIGKGDAGRILVRSVRSEGGADGRLEAMSLIVRSSVSAMAAGATIGLLPPPAAGPVKPPPLPCAPPRPAPAARMVASVAYGAFGFGTALSHGVQLSVGVRLLDWLHAGLSFRALQAMHADTPSTRMTIARYPVGLGLRARWRRGRFGLEGGAGVWLERLHWEVTPKEANVRPTDDSGRWVVAAQGFLGLSWQLTTTLALMLQGGVDVPHDTRSFRVAGAVDEEVAAPWAVQPWVLGGVRFALF